MDGPLLSHCMVDGKSARRCSSRFFDNSMCRWRNSIGCADNPNVPLGVHDWWALTVDPVMEHYGRGSPGSARDALTAEARVVVTGNPVRDPARIRASYLAFKDDPEPRIVNGSRFAVWTKLELPLSNR